VDIGHALGLLIMFALAGVPVLLFVVVPLLHFKKAPAWVAFSIGAGLAAWLSHDLVFRM
jgi:hypothetical protein